MSTWVVLATGQSLTPAHVERVRDSGAPTVVVSDAFRLAPWATALASQDKAWWRRYPEALKFAGRKFTTRTIDGVEKVPADLISTSSNSGLFATHVARLLGAQRVLLLGVDLHGTHYFGPHPDGLTNTRPRRFEAMRRQFARYPRGPLEIVNCSPGSALDCFPRAELEQVL